MSSREVDAAYHARLRLLAPLLVVGGVLFSLLAVMFWGENNWARDAGLVLAGVVCFIASYLIHRSARRGHDLPQSSRRLIYALSGAVILLMIISIFS